MIRKVFEAHLSTATLVEGMVKEHIKKVFAKVKFFGEVVDYEDRHSVDVPPTGHDMEAPFMMISGKFLTLSEAVQAVVRGTEILEMAGINSRFEIEGILGGNIQQYEEEIDLEKMMPGFCEVPLAPHAENHIIWRGSEEMLPTASKIAEWVKEIFGHPPSQVVNFSRVENPRATDLISRIATIYQPDVETVLAYATRLEGAAVFPTTPAYHVGERALA